MYFNDLGYQASDTVLVRDAVAHADLGMFKVSYTRPLQQSESATLVVTPV